MAIGVPRPEKLADWDVATFTTAPLEELPEAGPEDVEALPAARPEELVEVADFGGEGEFAEQSQVSKFGYVDESHKLYVGKEFTPEQFADWWSVQSFGSLEYNGVGIHHTAIPDRHTFEGLQHIHNIFDFYNRQYGWPRGKGPQLWLRSKRKGLVPGPKIYVGTHPASDGIGISYRNHRYLHIEFLDRFDYYGMDQDDYALYRYVLRIVCGERGIPLKHCSGTGYDGPSRPMDGYLFHRRAKTNIKTCPGSQVHEAEFDRQMNRGGSPAPPPAKKGLQWINCVHHREEPESGKIARAMAAGFAHKDVGLPAGTTRRNHKAVIDALTKEGVYSILVGERAISGVERNRKKIEREAGGKTFSLDATGNVQTVEGDLRVVARWRIAALCDEYGADKGRALDAYEAAL
jgi:hypothetical protein